MAWQAATLRPASLELPWCTCNQLSFARIIPSNDRAKIEAAFLAEQKEEGGLCQWHGKFFHARNVSPIDAYTPTDSYSESDIEEDYSKSWDSHYGLNLDDLAPLASPLTFRIGSGTPDTTKEDNDVDIVTSYPGRSTHRVTPIHCGITLGSSGVCLIKALSSTQPTIVFIENEPLTLTLGETHVLCYRTNRFMIGKLEYNFVYNKLGKDAYAAYIDQRNTLYKSIGVPLPDPRVWGFPSARETRIHGPAIVQVGDGGGISQSVRVGVDARTGRPLAIKSIKVGADRKWNDIIDGIQALLSFEGARGLLQAVEIRCAHGHHVNHKNVAEHQGILMPFCAAQYDTIYMITSLAHTDFRAYGWANWAEKGLPFQLTILRDILQGIKVLHDAGYMHRNISEQNLLVVSENPPVAIISNFEQSIEAKTSIEERIGPAHIKAPEVGVTAYSNRIDIWNLGVVALSMFFPMAYDLVNNFGGAQEEVWYSQMEKELDEFRIQGDREALIARVIRSMLDDDPHKRPSAAQALACLPDFNWERMAYEELPTIPATTSETPTKRKAIAFSLDEPSRKRTDRGDVALSSEGDHGEDLDDRDDFKFGEQDQLDSTLKVVRSLSPDGNLQKLLKAMPHTIDDEDVALSSEGDDEEDVDDNDDSVSNEQDRLDSALKALRNLPANSDLHQLLEAMPNRVALADLVSHCKGKDAQLIQRMLRGKEELKGFLGLEISGDSENEVPIPVPRTSRVEDSGQHREGDTLLINSNAADQKTDAGTSIDEAEGGFQNISEPSDVINTGPQRFEEQCKDVEYIDLEDSEEE